MNQRNQIAEIETMLENLRLARMNMLRGADAEPYLTEVHRKSGNLLKAIADEEVKAGKRSYENAMPQSEWIQLRRASR